MVNETDAPDTPALLPGPNQLVLWLSRALRQRACSQIYLPSALVRIEGIDDI